MTSRHSLTPLYDAQLAWLFSLQNTAPSITSSSPIATNTIHPPPSPAPPGVRPSPVSGHPTTSTGTPSLDALLSGHAGLPLGSSVVIEESGTTDFGGALLRYYAAEGVVHGHHVVVVGMGEGIVPGGRKERERMKIAWRYERLAAGGTGVGGTGTTAAANESSSSSEKAQGPFCHSFDLTKRLEITPDTKITYIPLPPPTTSANPSSPFTSILSKLATILTTSPPNTITRLVIPSLLSPALYPPHAPHPPHLLQFLHSLRALLRTHSSSLTAMLSLPLELYPRTMGLVRWIELLADTVVELVPVGSLMEQATRAAAKGREDMPMGLIRVWKVPEKKVGGGGGAVGVEDLAFTVTRRRFGIGMFSLQPEGEDDGGISRGRGGRGKTKVDIEF
ncbi:PAXNEB-domain-containing protein [Terfezia boudieri ATCC MYA-4762]|uniref:Elongator complex protein 4 n=1 Tax=Terfezia boudieri ATCC MYA-4762 TaxID=1051890 RepID=A0A3N4LM58_9PEZI|nr:PAXNEB-domain-containing protein [Terfezia boudieri ATCC MYA-4762]